MRGVRLRRWLPSLLWMLAVLPAAALEVPYLAGRVNDYAGMLDPDTEARLDARLASLESSHGAQLVVLTVPALEGEALEDFSLRVAETWGLGVRGADNGVLFLVARDDRQMRLEVGYGLEGVLPDAVTGRILRGNVQPFFREGRFGAGIEAGVDAVARVVEGGDVRSLPAARTQGEGPALGGLLVVGIFLVTVGTFSWHALFLPGFAGWSLYLFLAPFWLIFPGAALGWPWGLGAAFAWLAGFPILRWILRRTGAGKAWVERHRSMVLRGRHRGGRSPGGWGGWSASGGSSGGFSSGGFSGGGGSFGGGGASSSW